MINPSIKGTIYYIRSESVKGKKDPTATYTKYLLGIEIPGKFTNFHEFEAFEQDLSMYAKQDFVEIDYELKGFRYKKEDGTEKIINKSSITGIKYADLETKAKHVKHVDASKVDYSKLMVKLDEPEISEMDDNDQLPF